MVNTGFEAPDYERAAMIQPLINHLKFDIERLEKLAGVDSAPRPFAFYLTRLMTDHTVGSLELWAGFKDSWNDVTVRILTIRKSASARTLTCTLQFTELVGSHLYDTYTTRHLVHIGWTAGRGGKTFWFKARIKNPAQVEAFIQSMAVTMLEALELLWRYGPQYYRFV